MLQAYLYITKMRMLGHLAYRFQVFTSIIANLIVLVASVYVWRAASAGIGPVKQMGAHQLVTYTTVMILLSTLFVCGVQNSIYLKVRDGSIATDFYRPISLLTSYLAEDLGDSISALVNKVLPLLVFASLLFGFPAPSSWSNLLLFLPSCLLSYAILWLLSALVGLLAFWVIELGNLGMVKDSLVAILSGSMVPLWFFPGWMQKVTAYLPFPYTYQTPVSIYIGRASIVSALEQMGVQLVWIGLLLAIVILCWKKTKAKTMIQGG